MSDYKYLYVIEHPDGFVKIGKASKPMSRFYSVQTGSPYELSIRYLMKYSPASVFVESVPVESKVHEAFEDKQVRGEWFDVSPERVLHYLARESRDDVSIFRIYCAERERQRKQECDRLHVSYRGPF